MAVCGARSARTDASICGENAKYHTLLHRGNGEQWL